MFTFTEYVLCSKVSALRLIFGKISQSFLLTCTNDKHSSGLIINNQFTNIGMIVQQVSMYESGVSDVGHHNSFTLHARWSGMKMRK